MNERNTPDKLSIRELIALVKNALGLKANSADLATVAMTGSYNDLSDRPTIPTVTLMLIDSDGTVIENKHLTTAYVAPSEGE